MKYIARQRIILSGRVRFVLLTWIFILIACYGFSHAESLGSVNVRAVSWVSGSKIYLKDIANIKGPAHLKKQLENIYLGNSPKPGREKRLKGSWIKSKIRSKKLGSVYLKIPSYITINRSSQELDSERFLMLYSEYIEDQLKGTGADFKVRQFKIVGNKFIPDGKAKIEILKQNRKKLMGRVNLTAIVRVGSKFKRRFVLSGWVDRFEEVVCAVRRLKRNVILSNDDVYINKVNISKLSLDVFRSPEEVIGKRLKRSARPDDVLLSNMIDIPPIINKGDKVIIIARSSTLLIKTIGIAQTPGFLGKQIIVQNLTSKKNVIAKVIDASTVIVDF
ncbi:flagella basal body P-ring formation protein FlgA [Candidatus Magnetomoraceae bacterium gMMP-1]